MTMTTKSLWITLACIISSCAGVKIHQPLYNGQDLSAFQVLNGSAEYRLENGSIVGTTRTNTPNTFLATKKRYSDFILEFDVWADTLLNSGVQIRSNSLTEYKEGRVHGYQVEIESSDRKWAGGVYDEGRRGWLYPLTDNKKGQGAFQRNEWNHYRIEALGPYINTWINGIHCARLIDDMTDEGFIAFQVHSIGEDDSMAGLDVKWKNIRIITKDVSKHKTEPDPEVPIIDLRSKKE